jgi:peroxiredoxin
MQRRVLVLPIAAAIIGTLCAYRLLREERPTTVVAATMKRQPPSFELFDSESPPNQVRLISYLGRHQIILVFFDGRLGADRDPALLWFARNAKQIEAANIKVFGISGALSPQNRAAVKRLEQQDLAAPFVLLADPPPTEGAPGMGYLVHNQWGRYDRQTGQSLQGLFLIDRAGQVPWNENGPVPMSLDDMTDAIEVKGISGRWVVLGMFTFAIMVTCTLYLFWHLHTAPFRPLQEALAAEYEGSHPLVQGGQRKMHMGTPRILRVVLRVEFDPNDEGRKKTVDKMVDRIIQLADKYHGLTDYDTLEIHLAHIRPEKETQQREILRDVSEIKQEAGSATRPASGSAKFSRVDSI